MLRGRRVAHVLALEEHVDFTERRPVDFNAVPTLDHEVVDLTGAVGRLTEHNVELMSGTAAGTVVDDLVVGECFEWTLTSKSEDFPQCYRERPDVTLTRELVLQTQHSNFSVTRIAILDCFCFIFRAHQLSF